jgi:hypothetical protein
MAVAWDKALFDAAYEVSAEPDGWPHTREGIRLHYNRWAFYPEAQRRAAFFVQQFGLGPTSSVLLLGCGFGWTAEALSDLGIDVVGTDVSPYIHSVKDTPEDSELSAEITRVGLDPASGEGLAHLQRLRAGGVRTRGKVLNENSANNASRNRVRQALKSGNVTLVITEDVITSLTDSEITTLRGHAAGYGVPLAHFVTENANPAPPFGFNSKTLAQWKALLPNDTIIADGLPYRVA